jgi:GT2 family glycosyltransferase
MISVVFLNYNRKIDLNRSLEKIFLQIGIGYEVIVIDQNSTDGSLEMIRERFPQVQLHALEENLGVAGGRNYGASKAKGEYLIFVDDDAEFVDINSLYKISLVFDNNKNVNVIAFNINGHPERPEKFMFFSAKKDKFTNKYIGCGHAIRKEVFEHLGGYTRTLFFWGEEIEFAIKTFSIPGNKILYKGDVILFHRVSQVSRLKWKEGRFYYKVRNRLALMKRLFPTPLSNYFLLYYKAIYLIRAFQLSDFESYKKGIREFSDLEIEKGGRLSISNSFKYLFP